MVFLLLHFRTGTTMDTDVFRKLCFGIKFSKSEDKFNETPTPSTEKKPDEFGIDSTSENGQMQTETGTRKRKRKKKKAKVLGEAKQKEQEINALKNKMRIHTSGEEVPDPVTQFDELQWRYGAQTTLLANVTCAEFEEPTPIQMQAIPVMMQGRDIMACAPTGSGKTAAFVIPVLHHLREPVDQGFRALLLAPTRELAKQTLEVCRQLSEGIGLRSVYIDNANKAVKYGPNSKKKFDILVSTPNRLVFMLKHDPPLIDLSGVEWLVVDECDKLFEDGEAGFQDQLAVIDNACSVNSLRRAFFSATFAHDVKLFCQNTMDNVIQVNVGARNAATHLVKQELLFVGGEAGKRLAMRNLIREGVTPPVLVFVQSKQRAKELYTELMYDKIKVDVIHADRTQAERDLTVRNFIEGRVWALICTELMGRGIDFRGINLVVNYDFPTNAVSYIHRIGRTGRAGVPGRAITFFTEEDATHLRSIANIMKESGCEVPDYMFRLKKASKRDKKKKFPVKRKGISTVLYEGGKPKRRKLSQSGQQKKGHPTARKQSKSNAQGPRKTDQNKQRNKTAGKKRKKDKPVPS